MQSVAFSLQWRHNEHDDVSNHQPHEFILNCLSRRRSKKISNIRVICLCEGKSPVTGELPAQRASNVEHISLWWRHHVLRSPAIARLEGINNGNTPIWHFDLLEIVWHQPQTLIVTLTHWSRVTHICVVKLTLISSDNGLSPERRQAIIWTNAGILLIGPLGTNFSDILIEIQTFSL